ncbi:MAG TPA: CaiB/BaiF CoA-transferase family protein [Tepidiformaceae bacterium]|nr:CaiB/BaiF CoA-transferase family protein [Tepidiformaceae bacterium]
MARPLEDLKVLDLTWVLSGPFASMLLCDLGADVIKVERPPYGDIARTTAPYQNGWSTYFFSINRGKRSVAIDLRKEAGRDIFKRMATKVDIVMENFTPGTMDRLGVGYEALSEQNPRLIMASTSGFGQTGPDRDKPALDIVVQAMGGILSITGEPGGPPIRPGASYGDISAGLYTTVAILAALHERERSGLGQYVDISMLDCQVNVLENAVMRYFVTGKAPEPLGTRHPSATPFQAFPTADGHMVVALGFGEENQWQLLCGFLGLTDLLDNPDYETSPKRTQRHAELEPILAAAFKKRTTAEWLADFESVGLPCGPVRTIPEVVNDPQVRHRGMIQEVTHPTAGTVPIANTPFKFSRSEAGITGKPPPDFGADTADVLAELLGMSGAEVAAAEASGLIATSGGPDIALIT